MPLPTKFPTEPVVSFPIPSGASMTEVFDWERSLREAVAEAAKDLSLGLASGTGASTAGLDQVSITVNSEPSGADIIVDGDFMGNTPAEIKIDKGRHTLEIDRQGHQKWSRQINATDGLKISPVLEKHPQAPTLAPKE